MMRSGFFLVEWLCFVALVKGSLSPGSSLDSPGTSNDSRIATLLSIVGEFGFPRVFEESWKGDNPCNWVRISCIEGNIVAITFIYMNLTGTISKKFSDLSSLEVIDLSHNSLTGTIPVELLTKLRNLKTLDVSYNNLHGKLPKFRKGVINAEGNPQMEKDLIDVSSELENNKKSIDEGLFIGSMVAFVLAVGVGCIVFYAVMRFKRSTMLTEPNEVVAAQAQQSNDDDEIVEDDDNAIPFEILKNATEDFAETNVIGSGGFGAVYKGKLLDGTEVAVKRMKQSNDGKGIDEFKSEVSVLTKVHHRNLVVLHGYCLEGNERILVYQYMQQGTLSKHLFDWKDQGLKPLEWTRRLTIALDVARGLEYLHTLARNSQSYIHRDLKPSNILLGDDLRARVSDFGLVRTTAESRESFMTKTVGTFGYIAPEYTLTGRVTRKIDVYSFGVILMELLTGQKAIDENRSEDEPHIAVWFRRMCRDKDTLASVIDKTLQVEEETEHSINEVAKLASHCCSRLPEQRPEMSQAVTVLASLTEGWKPNEIVEENTQVSLPEMVANWQKKDLKESSNISVV